MAQLDRIDRASRQIGGKRGDDYYFKARKAALRYKTNILNHEVRKGQYIRNAAMEEINAKQQRRRVYMGLGNG